MSHTQASTSPMFINTRHSVAESGWAQAVFTLIGALLQPGQLIRDVERMGKLLQEANRVEAHDPARAATLRREASRVIQ